jgi:hypothetical protein
MRKKAKRAQFKVLPCYLPGTTEINPSSQHQGLNLRLPEMKQECDHVTENMLTTCLQFELVTLLVPVGFG